MFLHEELEKEISMDLPLCFNMHLKIKKVYKLKQTLYELKQSPRTWFGKFAEVMIIVSYKQSHSDIFFVKHLSQGE